VLHLLPAEPFSFSVRTILFIYWDNKGRDLERRWKKERVGESERSTAGPAALEQTLSTKLYQTMISYHWWGCKFQLSIQEFICWWMWIEKVLFTADQNVWVSLGCWHNSPHHLPKQSMVQIILSLNKLHYSGSRTNSTTIPTESYMNLFWLASHGDLNCHHHVISE
jgi:hypothetical protein